jgi:hypothetical protein
VTGVTAHVRVFPQYRLDVRFVSRPQGRNRIMFRKILGTGAIALFVV